MTPFHGVQYNRFLLVRDGLRVELPRMAVQTGVILRPLAVMMNRKIRTVEAGATLVAAAEMMREARVGALLVVEAGAYVGVLSETDLVRRAMATGMDPSQSCVRAIMSAPLITVEIDRSAHDASDTMAEHGIRHLPVTQDGLIVGMISVRDLLRYFKNWGTM
ncbi:MAG TPA: CBS domain-containing protein [Nitrospiraceae bacterium]|nr:CBS domain-containing protein [Nitrospiraceae bacterium]